MPPSGTDPVIRFPAIDSPRKPLSIPGARNRHWVTSGWALWVLLLSFGIVVLLFGQLAIGRAVDYVNQEVEQEFALRHEFLLPDRFSPRPQHSLAVKQSHLREPIRIDSP